MTDILRFSALGAVVLALAGGPQVAEAQLSPQLNVQQFVPAASYHEFLVTDSARIAPALTPFFDLQFNYAHRPLQREDQDFNRLFGIVDGVVGGDFRAGFAFTNFLDVSLNFPFMQLGLTGDGAPAGYQNSTFYSIGDLGLTVRVAPLNADKMPIGLAIIPFVTFPTGNSDLYASDGHLTFGGKLAISKRIKFFHFAVHAGYMVKPGSQIVQGSISAGDEVPYGAAVGISPTNFMDINVELMGTGMIGSNRENIADNVPKTLIHAPLELLANLRFRTPIGLDITVGGGPGLTPGAGTPAFRVFGGVSWAVAEGAGDPDGDGITGATDKCPKEKEDFDGFEDADGCPEDNDNDGVADADDQCPDEPEDQDGWIDNDGCPDTDNDGDGVLDADDQCPNEAEDIDSFADDDGCPEDNDEDGVPDDKDQCPDEAEDQDGFEDADGCPDPDNDGDGVLDADDVCPDQPENINGEKDEDGCPDDVRAIVKGEKIVILDRVFFVTGKDTIIKKSFPVLNAVAQTLVDTPLITKVQVDGHTDARGEEESNQALSEQRAQAVVKYLVGKGVDAGRLTAKGFGESKPIDSNETDEGMQNNRRVEFNILEQSTPEPEPEPEPEPTEEEGAEGEGAEEGTEEAPAEE
ncbi:MAG: OmpA family protein [Deltaproteobacteria bacterium]|nr:OmpA family protein [Deltaproteobacteria bacterium]